MRRKLPLARAAALAEIDAMIRAFSIDHGGDADVGAWDVRESALIENTSDSDRQWVRDRLQDALRQVGMHDSDAKAAYQFAWRNRANEAIPPLFLLFEIGPETGSDTHSEEFNEALDDLRRGGGNKTTTWGCGGWQFGWLADTGCAVPDDAASPVIVDHVRTTLNGDVRLDIEAMGLRIGDDFYIGRRKYRISPTEASPD